MRAFTARSEHHSIFTIGFHHQCWMIWAVAASFLLVLAVVYIPFFQPFFDTVPLGVDDWLLMLPFFLAAPAAMELLKAWFRWSAAHAAPAPAAAAGAARPGAGPETDRPGRFPAAGVMKVLVPVAASHSSRYAVQQVVRRFMNDSSMEVHLLNVQPPLSWYASRFLSAQTLRQWHKAESDRILEPCQRILDKFGVPYSVHVELGEQAQCITELARRLRCDEIVMATARKLTVLPI